MNSITTEAGGFDKVVFESVIDTLAGGATLDVTGFENDDNVIPAGTFVGPKNGTTGLHPIVAPDGDGTLPGAVIGMVHHTIPLVAAGNNHVGVVLEGVARLAALPDAPVVSGDVTALKAALPKITFL